MFALSEYHRNINEDNVTLLMLINFLRCDETPDSRQIAPHFRLPVFAAMVSVTNCDVSGDQILRANRIFNKIAFSASKTQKYIVRIDDNLFVVAVLR